MYFCLLLVVLWKICATCIYICHFNNLDIFFVSFQNRERVHSSEKQRKWRSDRTKGKVQFVWCFYGNIDQWVISQKIVKLSELQFDFTSCKKISWNGNSCDHFLQLQKNIAHGKKNSRELTKIIIKNESIYFLFKSYGLDTIFFFQRLRTENRLLRQRIEALEKVLPVFICKNPQ